jgi:hypothetical protein
MKRVALISDLFDLLNVEVSVDFGKTRLLSFILTFLQLNKE